MINNNEKMGKKILPSVGTDFKATNLCDPFLDFTFRFHFSLFFPGHLSIDVKLIQ